MPTPLLMTTQPLQRTHCTTTHGTPPEGPTLRGTPPLLPRPTPTMSHLPTTSQKWRTRLNSMCPRQSPLPGSRPPSTAAPKQ